jgi:hypothetical protein
MTARDQWKILYRAIRVARREARKVAIDVMVYGTGVLYVPNNGDDIYRVEPWRVVYDIAR